MIPEQRGGGSHPGPFIAREFLAPLGLEPAELARHIGVDPRRLMAILRGVDSFDAETAVRLGRAFELPPDQIVQMQVKYDLASARNDPDVQAIGVLPAPAETAFPENALRGRLAEASDEGYGGFTWYFRENVTEESPPLDPYRGLHSLWVGDRLRVYDSIGRTLWTGPILKNLDGRMLLPYVRFQVWIEWFYSGLRADLAIGPEHRTFLDRLRAG
ncbi:MAG: HigA family addiction module antitoxin [Candidatus Baltobacteraceae bacterium]|jgi:addiction module HigA family antidote